MDFKLMPPTFSILKEFLKLLYLYIYAEGFFCGLSLIVIAANNIDGSLSGCPTSKYPLNE